MTQLNKLDKLIDQLQQQESGFLGELLRLMVKLSTKLTKNNQKFNRNLMVLNVMKVGKKTMPHSVKKKIAQRKGEQ